jgi:glycosyltransferase involved in cell wall biosynthesis
MVQTSKPKISVVILCYRSGNFARVFYKRVVDVLIKNNFDYEIVLVGNYRPGIGDTTPDVIREIAKTNERTVTVIKEKTSLEQGMGWDMRSGLDRATGETIAVIDGDGQMPPEDIPELYYKLSKENLDLCKAKRISRGDGIYRKFISNIFNMIMKVLFPGIVANDINAKPKLFTREAYNKLHLESNEWFIDGEIMIKARRYKFKIGEIETVFYENQERKSFISFKANVDFIKNIIFWRIKEFGK